MAKYASISSETSSGWSTRAEMQRRQRFKPAHYAQFASGRNVGRSPRKDQKVRGVIVAKTISENLRYAVGVIPDVSLFEYEVSFQLKPAHGIGGAG
jgi:hypothetical protein